METISGGPSEEFLPDTILQAAKLNKALENWVVTEVPGEDEGEIGDVVFVTGPGDGGSPGVGGKVLQVVTKKIPRYETNEEDWHDVPGMSVVITPQKNTSVILVAVSIPFARVSRNTPGEVASIFRVKDGNDVSIASGQAQSGALEVLRDDAALFWFCYDKPASTSQCTYKLSCKTGVDALMTLNHGASMYAIELEDLVVLS